MCVCRFIIAYYYFLLVLVVIFQVLCEVFFSPMHLAWRSIPFFHRESIVTH